MSHPKVFLPSGWFCTIKQTDDGAIVDAHVGLCTLRAGKPRFFTSKERSVAGDAMTKAIVEGDVAGPFQTEEAALGATSDQPPSEGSMDSEDNQSEPSGSTPPPPPPDEDEEEIEVEPEELEEELKEEEGEEAAETVLDGENLDDEVQF